MADRTDPEAQRRRSAEMDRALALSEAREFAAWLLERTDARGLPTAISWLRGTKPKDVIAALRGTTTTADEALAFPEAQEFAAWLKKRAAPREVPMLITWLQDTNPKDVTAALRTEAA
jgi:hypothetical protein